MMSGKWHQFGSYGFGGAVVADDGTLVAYGKGVPPEWTDSAAAAEAWALCVIA